MFQSPSPYNRVSQMSVVGTPTGMRMSMKYATHVQLSSGMLPYDEHVFRAFSIFDPDQTGVGHQPLGHDQWAALYTRYRVLGAQITVKFSDQTQLAAGTQQTPTTCVVCLNTNTTTLDDSETAIETPMSRNVQLGRGGNSKTVYFPYVSAWKSQGDMGGLTEDDYSATFGNNPNADAYFHILAERAGSSTVDTAAQVTIVYDCWIYDPVDLTQS